MENLKNVAKYNRNGFKYVTLFRYNDFTKNQLSEKELVQTTFKGYEQVENIIKRIDSEMMQIQSIKVEGDNIFVSYIQEGVNAKIVAYSNTEENLSRLRDIKDRQDKIKNTVIKPTPRVELQVKKVEKGEKKHNKRFIVLGLAAALAITGITLNGNKGKNNITNISQDSKHEYSIVSESNPTLKPVTELNYDYSVVPEPTPTLKPIPIDLYYTAQPTREVPTITAQPVYEIPVITPQPVYEESIEDIELPFVTPRPTTRPMIVDEHQIDNSAIEKFSFVVMEAAKSANSGSTPIDSKASFTNQEMEAAYQLLNSNFAYLENKEERFGLVVASTNISKQVQSYSLYTDNQDAALSNHIMDPVSSANMKRVENLVNDVRKGRVDKKVLQTEIENLNYDNPVESYFIVNLIGSVANELHTNENNPFVYLTEVEATLLTKIFEACEGKAIQR